MIIYKCDICKKKVLEINSIVLYNKRVDYCKECSTIANKVKKQMENSRDYYNKEFDKKMKIAERNILNKIKEEK